MNQTQLEELVVTLTAKVDGYVKNFQQVQAQTVETTKHIQNATEKVQGFTDSVTQFGQAALAGITGLGVAHWFKEVFNLAGGVEQQFLGLSTAIKSNTDNVDDTAEAYKRFSDRMFEVTGTSKSVTLSLLQMNEMQGISAQRSMDYAKQAIALGNATGMDPRSLINRLDMAQTGAGAQMLRRVPGLRGITDDAMLVDKANRLMAIGMDVSKAQMQSAAGMVKKLSEELEEVKKQFGKLLLDALKPGIELLTKTVQWFKDLDERTKLVILSLAGMTVGVVALVNGLKLLNMAASVLFSGTGGLLAVMLPVAVAAALWAEHLGGVSKAWDLVKAKAQEFWDWISPVAQGVWDGIRIGAMVAANAVISAFDIVAAMWRPFKDLLVEGWKEIEDIAAQVAGEIGSVWEPLEVAAASYAVTLATIGTALYVAIPKALDDLLPIGLRVFPLLATYAKEAMADVLEALKTAASEALSAITVAGSTAGEILARVGEWFAAIPAKIKNATNWIADLIEKLPAIIHETAKDLDELVGLVEGLARSFRWLNENMGSLPRGTAILAGMFAVATMLAGGLYKVGFILAGVAAGFATLGDKFIPLAAAFAAWLGWLGPKMSIMVGVITLLAARTDLVSQALAKVKEFFNWIIGGNEWIKNLADKVAGFFRWIGGAIGPAFAAIGEFFTSLGQAAVDTFNLLSTAASQAFDVLREVAGGAFTVISEAVASFNWNLQNTIMVIAGVVGVIAAMATFLLVWAVATKAVAVAMALLTVAMIPNKLLSLAWITLQAVGNALLLLTGVKLAITAAGWLAYGIAVVWAKLTTVMWTIAGIAAIAVMAAMLAAVIVLSAAIIAVMVVAFVAAASAVMALVDALKTMTLFSGAADAFSRWKSILSGLVMAVQTDMGAAWRYVQDAMKLAGEQVRAYWPPVWARIKQGFLLLWEVIADAFVEKLVRTLPILFEKGSLDNAVANLKLSKKELDEFMSKPLDLGNITTPGMEAAQAQVEANIANIQELAKLKKAADEEADKAAKKHKEELDTATRLNNLAQQHNELKRAELVLANSADALYKIQAYRMSQQAAMEARAAQLRKDVLEKEPGKGPAQLAYEVGLEADSRREDVSSALARKNAKYAATPQEALKAAEEWQAKVSTNYNKALDEAKTLNETLRVIERFRKDSVDSELALNIARDWVENTKSPDDRAVEDFIDRANGRVPAGDLGSAAGDVTTAVLLRIEELMKTDSKKPTLEMKPVGLK